MFMKALKRTGQKMKSFRFGSAIVFSFLVLVVMIGVVQASGPMRPPHPPAGGMWEMPSRPWWPMAPVPEIHIIAVEKNVSVTFETENFPEDEDFTVTMGYMYTRGKDGYVVRTFNSGDGESQELTFDVPPELLDEYRIAIRAQTDHTFPYYAFNWFYNNSTNGDAANGASDPVADETATSESDTGDADEAETTEETAAEQTAATVEQTALIPVEVNEVEEEEEVPSFKICLVEKDVWVEFDTSDFPADKLFTVKMGVMPNYPEPDPYYHGKMMPMPYGEMDMGMPMPPQGEMEMGMPMPPQSGMEMGMPMPPQGGMEMGMPMPPQGGMEMGMPMPPQGEVEMGMPMPQQGGMEMGMPMPPMYPPGKDQSMQPSKIWIPYYEAGTFETGDGGNLKLGFEIPAELAGAYRISIMMYSDDTYPYSSYNWFYNNDASVCEP